MSDAIKPLINAAANGPLTRAQAEEAFEILFEGDATPSQIGGFLMALRTRGETVDEYAAAAAVMRAKCNKVIAPTGAIDIVGTGGDGKHTLNISTATAFTVAGAGVPVAKHGNRNLSSKSGTADVQTAMGINVMVGPKVVERELREAGIGFMMAPMHHPAMKHVMPTRAELGTRTIFNILGPLTNPAGAQAQVLGVAEARLGRLMAEVLLHLRTHRTMVVHGEDGVDEITLSGPTNVWQVSDGAVHHYMIAPHEFGLDSVPLDRLKGGTPDENRVLMERVLGGEPGPLHDAVALNAGATLFVGGAAEDLRNGVRMAKEVLGGGAALQKLRDFAEASQRAEA